MAGLAIVAAWAVGACGKPQAKTVPDMPALEVPPPPPRDLALVETQTIEPIGLVEAPARAVLERPRPMVAPRDPGKVDPPKLDPAAVPARPADDGRPAGALLQTTPVGREDEVERRVRALLTSATTDLGRVEPRRLGADEQSQYDTAKGFIRQAEDALRAKNLGYAEINANKAAVLASQLAGR